MWTVICICMYTRIHIHIYFKEEDWRETSKWVILIYFYPKISPVNKCTTYAKSHHCVKLRTLRQLVW